MNATDHSYTQHEAQRAQEYLAELNARIIRALPKDGSVEPFEGLHLFRVSRPLGQVHSIARPSFCVIAQGSKEVLLGESRYRYDPSHYLISTVELPRVSQILEATEEKPYLGLRLDLDPALVSAMIVEADQVQPPVKAEVRAMDVSLLDVALLDATVRMVRLADQPSEARILLPLVKREIIYRLLMGNQGARLRHLAQQGGYTPLITKAVERLRQDFDQPLHIEDLARELGMSVSGLHHHFKAVTAMSPLQFQKQLRLQEARRLMISEKCDASSAAFRVGYHDPSHFNREYKSVFGVPPIRDVQRLREKSLTNEG